MKKLITSAFLLLAIIMIIAPSTVYSATSEYETVNAQDNTDMIEEERLIYSGVCDESDVKWYVYEKEYWYKLLISVDAGKNGKIPDYSLKINMLDVKSETAPWYSYSEYVDEIVITGGITAIGDYAFYNFSHVKSIEIPDSVTSIGKNSFSGCENLKSVKLPGGLSAVGNGAFSGCTSLESINLPNSLSSIGSGIFSGCKGIKSIKLPNNLPEINDQMFLGCVSLVEMEIPNTVKKIGDKAFINCISFKNLSIPSSVESIGDSAFSNIAVVKYSGSAEGSPWGAGAINGYTENEFVYSDSSKNKLCGYIGKSDSVIIPNTVTEIASGTFANCHDIRRVEIPNSVTMINPYTFYCCGLEEIKFPDSLGKIGTYAFYKCDRLTYIKVPNGINSIGGNAFGECISLKNIDIPNTVVDIGSYAFESVKNVSYTGQAIGAPWGARSVNGRIEKGYVYNADNSILLGYVGDETSITVPVNTPVAFGREFFLCKTIENAKIDTVTVTEHMFEGCINLKAAEILNNVYSIKDYAFKGCTSLEKVIVGRKVKNIGEGIFDGDTKLTVYCYPGSEMENYAKAHNIKYAYIDQQSEPIIQKKPVNSNVIYVTEEKGDILDEDMPESKYVFKEIWIKGYSDIEYTGKPITFGDLRVYDGTTLLVKNVDYKVAYKNNKNVGTATIIISGKGNYSFRKECSFNITEQRVTSKSINKASVLKSIKNMTYTGKKISQNQVELKLGETILKKDIDYSTEYIANTNVGVATVIYRGKGEYCGAIQSTFKITPLAIAGKNTLTCGYENEVAYAKGGAVPTIKVSYNGITLKKGVDYTVALKNNKKVGIASFIITGKGNFKGKTEPYTFKVVPQDISKLSIRVPDVIYKEKANIYKSKPVITDLDGKVLKVGTDYENDIEYTLKDGVAIKESEILPQGTVVYAKIRGKGTYSKKDGSEGSGYLMTSFRVINPTKTITKSVILLNKDIYYDGTECCFDEDDLSISLDGGVLKADDYEIISYLNNIKKGSATCIVHGIGQYGGYKLIKYKILPRTGFLSEEEKAAIIKEK